MWGTPGTLVAAQAMLEATGDERWRDAWQAGAEALWSRRDADGSGHSGSTARSGEA